MQSTLQSSLNGRIRTLEGKAEQELHIGDMSSKQSCKHIWQILEEIAGSASCSNI